MSRWKHILVKPLIFNAYRIALALLSMVVKKVWVRIPNPCLYKLSAWDTAAYAFTSP